ncbi:MAG: NAD-dependent dehydratase [Cellvibrio sp. 79]|nr:MAG: NAD-dependent dehydratase [Cellvibrio sp. 79]
MAERIMVTGGAGFIGAHLCAALIKSGYRVLCVDNLSSGNLNNLKHLKNHPDFEFYYQDITTPFNADVKQIYNLACPASPHFYQADPIQTIKTCVQGSMNVLDIARAHGARILQASTSEIYGDPEVHPQQESYRGSVSPIGARACYNEGKRCAETLFFDYQRLYSLDIKLARIFNTYGPGMAINDGRVVSNFIVQALRGANLTIYGDGKQTRSFCYVDDMVEGLILMMNSHPGFAGPVNMGNPEEISIGMLAETIVSLCNSNSRIAYMHLPDDDPKRRCPDIMLASEKLNWCPTTTLIDGLIKTIDYYRSILNANS